MDDFQKKVPASPCQKKKIACSTNEIEIKFLHCCKQEKKMLQSYFISPGGLYKNNPSKTATLTILPLLPLNSGVGYASECAMHS